jgi:two-component system nitrate/nitrite response regulator NarL
MLLVFHVADVRVYREGLAQLLGSSGTIKVVGTAPASENVLPRLRALGPDIVLVDMTSPGGLHVAKAIRAGAPDVPVISFGLPETETSVIACAEAGLSGFVSAHTSLADLITSLECAAQGDVVCSPRVAGILLRRIGTQAGPRRREGAAVRLTAREHEIVQLIETGLTNKEIARRLHIELATVKNHVHNILEKLQVNRRADAVARVRGERPRAREPVGLD